MSGAPLSIPAGVPSEGVLLRFWINFRFPNSVPVSGGGRGGLRKARLHLGDPLVSQIGVVHDRLTECHSSHRHGAHTIGLRIVFQGLLP